MKKIIALIYACFILIPAIHAQENTQKRDSILIEPVNQKRVKEIAAMLPDEPRGYGVPYTNREAWDKLLKSGKCRAIIVAADKFNTQPFPPMTEEIYMSFFKGKDSETSKTLTMRRRSIFATLVWAECLTNKGKYMTAIENAMNDLLTTKSWNFPAEDRTLTNYKGTQYTINLSPADYGSDVAQTLYLLADKIKPEMRKQAMDVLYQKVFNPTLQAIKTKNKNREFKSLLDMGNHNSVTLSGVTNAALTVIKNKEERATFITIAERYSKNGLAGFTDDGYCTEGVAYYNYGMSYYVLLRETIYQATGGKVDIFNDPKVKKIGLFIPRMEIINGVYPAIGDCSAIPKPSGPVVYYLNRNFHLGLSQFNTLTAPSKAPLSNLMYFFPNSASLAKTSAPAHGEGLRSYFDIAGVLTVRPAANSSFNMGATLKGGNNNENHNHNDVGSFSIAVGDEMLMGDAGLATYTPKTFSPERYNVFKTIASYGHAVPLLAGIQQHAGADAKALISGTSFTDKEDKMTMDITSAYTIKGLKKIIRNFTYNRSDNGFLEVKDDVEFTTPQSYETALITRANWKQTSANTIELTGKKNKLIVTISVPGSGFTLSSETINESPVPYTRLGIKLKEPMKSGSVKMTFTPAK